MKQLFWISSVNVVTNTFLGAAAIQANSARGACEKAEDLGIISSPEVEVACFQLPWEERLNYQGYLHRFLTKEEVVSLGCKSIKDWQEGSHDVES